MPLYSIDLGRVLPNIVLFYALLDICLISKSEGRIKKELSDMNCGEEKGMGTQVEAETCYLIFIN